jgi:hypothetical protein
MWRQEFNADNLTLEDAGVYGQRRVTVVYGRDKKGRPVVNTISGRQPAYDRDMNEVTKFVIYTFDKALALAAPEEKLFSVIDLSSFSLMNMDYTSAKLFVDCLQLYYPETLGQMLVGKKCNL